MMLASALETPAYAECRQAAVAACRVIPHGVVSVANGAYNIRITPFSRPRRGDLLARPDARLREPVARAGREDHLAREHRAGPLHRVSA